MAATRKKNKPRPDCFLGCFGFSQKMIPGKSYKNRKSTRWFSWSRFRSRKIDSKTVPVDSTATDHKTVSEPVDTLKSYGTKKIVPPGLPSNQQTPRKVPAVSTVASYNDTDNDTDTNTKPISREFQTRPDNDEKYPNRVFLRGKTDPTRTSSSQPGSPDAINTRTKETRAASLSHSISLPATTRDVKPVRSKKNRKIRNGNGGKIDPIVGLSVVMVTLLIMLLWGRLCAILCTSAWCYCVSCIRTGNQRNIRNDVVLNSESAGEPDLSSSEHKKKVVLEGFMRRNHRY